MRNFIVKFDGKIEKNPKETELEDTEVLNRRITSYIVSLLSLNSICDFEKNVFVILYLEIDWI